MATKVKGKKLTKKQQKLVERCVSDKLFDRTVWLRTQTLGTHLLRIINIKDDAIFMNLDREYFMYNFKTKKCLQYNTDEKNEVNCDADLEKLWKEVA